MISVHYHAGRELLIADLTSIALRLDERLSPGYQAILANSSR